MSLHTRLLAEGPGWRVRAVACSAGPRDPAFEERHAEVCVAAVLAGSFQYRTGSGRALLAPGAVMLGNAGECFECGHEHGTGDHCLAFHFDPGTWESLAASVPSVRSPRFVSPRLPPRPELTPLLAAAEALANEAVTERAAFEELALRIGMGVLELSVRTPAAPQPVPARDERRIASMLRWIEARAAQPLPLSRLATEAAMSPAHFLRTFARVVGLTPHQFVLRARLQQAARRLREGDEGVAEVALAAGFDDLSTFHRRFRRYAGCTPAQYRGCRS